MTTSPRLDLAVWGEDLAELADASATAERAGAGTIWFGEMHHSATVQLAAAATATSTVRIGSAIMLAFVRSPMIAALEALDLDEFSDGRLALGFGTGVRRLNEDWHNVEWERPVTHLREVVRNVRHLVAHAHEGERIELEGERVPLRIRDYQRPRPPRRTEIPLLLAAVGPSMTRLAGRVGDGWIAHELGSPRYLKEAIMPNLKTGLERAGRARADFEVVASACCVPDEDGARARRIAAGAVAFYATVRTYEPLFEFHGFLDEARAVQAAFRAGDHEAMVDAVPDAMVDALTIAGSPDEVRERLAGYSDLADAVKLSPPTYFVPPAVTREVQSNIISILGEA